MNAAEQARAAARLSSALVGAGIQVLRVVNNASQIGRLKHQLVPVAPEVLIGAWMARGYLVNLDIFGLPATPAPGEPGTA
jgi:hypothetical protein